MMLDQLKHIYFIGIGGIGMSAIARYFHTQGIKVSGYDKTKTDLTSRLESEGMHIHYEDDKAYVPGDLDLVIYTPAIPSDHNELSYLLQTGIPVIKRSEALGLISKDSQSIGIAGTHGKTTTSTMVTHVLKVGGLDVSAFLGGISTDYSTNCLIGQSNVVVLEADEYDRSFLRLNPFIASISSMDADHLDIYGNREEMIKGGFLAYVHRIQDNGHLILKEDLLNYFNENDWSRLKSRGINIDTFGTALTSDIRISNVRVVEGKYVFDYEGLGSDIKSIELSLPGMHNVENACVAISIGLLNGVEEKSIREALANFKGIKRRFEKVFENNQCVYIDDYAHHPGEIKMAIDAARTLYPGRELTVIFQPHLYTRTRDFVDGFAEELDKSDSIILMDIYPARELPIAGISSEIIFNKIKNPNKTLVDKETLMTRLKECHWDVVMTLGAGDIDTFVTQIKDFLIIKFK